MQSIYEIAADFQKELQNKDTEFWDRVTIHHHDGTFYDFNKAIAHYYEDWVMVFTANQGYHVFYEADLFSCCQYRRVHMDELPAKEEKDVLRT